MSDAGDSHHHKRSKSTVALALLRGKHRGSPEIDDNASDGSQSADTTSPHHHLSTAADTPSAAMTQPSSSQPSRRTSKPSASAASLARVPSAQNSPPRASLDNKGVSLEQSVRKFRIVEALRSGDTASISKAIRETTEAGSRTSISSASGPGLLDTTILHLAIQCAEYPVVEYILSNGNGLIDINARDKDGNTPLHIAAGQGRNNVVRLLLEQESINDAITNNHGRVPIDVARTPEIYQQLQLARSIFTDAKIHQIQELVAREDYGTLRDVLEEQRLKTMLDINNPEFASDTATVDTGGTLLHEAARKRNTKLIQILLLHGADPFRRDRKGKLPQDVTKDDVTRSMLKRSPAAVAAQRGIQEKAVLGHAASQGAASTSGDTAAGREGREMKGYLKKWTNYRKGYQLRWFVLEDGVMSYYKHQDDTGSACRGAINMRIAKLHMSAEDKTKFEVHGKSSVKYTLKANHEVEAKRWFWALNNSIQWTKDQAKEEERQKARAAELLRAAKADRSGSSDMSAENLSVSEANRSSLHIPRGSISRTSAHKSDHVGPSTIGSVDEDDADYDRDDNGTDAGLSRHASGGPMIPGDMDDDDDDESQLHAVTASKDAFNITAQAAKIQLDTLSAVNISLQAESKRNPELQLGDQTVSDALVTYDSAINTLTELVGNLLKISKDRDAYWQYRLDREVHLRRMWEESMAKVAREQEALEVKFGEAEVKRKLTKKALKEAMTSGKEARGDGQEVVVEEKRQEKEVEVKKEPGQVETEVEEEGEDKFEEAAGEAQKVSPKSLLSGKPSLAGVSRRQTALEQMADMSDTSESDDEEFFDAIDEGDVHVTELPPTGGAEAEKSVVVSGGVDISSSFKGYENGIRTRLKMDADDRPKISLWGILKSMIGKDMTKMTLPVSFNEPTSLLYRCGEDMEYADLLDIAAERTDSLERLMYVAAFASSEYASTIGRVAKPFNPLLGETFEYVRPDKNYRFFIEQVSHHPPVGAAWAESPNWTYYGESAVKSKFYGKSFDINPLGTWFLRLQPKSGGKEDFYTWKKVTSSVIGIITGNPTVDNYGPMEVKNWTTGEVCYIEFKPRGWKASSAYQIAGKVTDASGHVCYSIGGRWNSKIYARRTPGYEATPEEPKDAASTFRGSMSNTNSAFLLWKANERPEGIPFNLTPFVLTFNHIDDNLRKHIAPTDSRLRPDQRAMEDGEYDFAATEKNRLEEAQRARRRIREAKGLEFKPAWFSKEKCEVTGESYWKFNGGYWVQREKWAEGDEKAWDGLEQIYEDVGDGPIRRATTKSLG
ncbi:related to oxysterol-binding protein [Cephalotrichum gorgonifer]|uniref:Related to oxysterol-binding protein n=1 Tax=Cephalotrichum gorgonifer TaxID=2041049 RepID=A0AAE8ST63_9PEZI|nr:related to oxysterol-binding protein [Cephalotrichum gorgonifer]